MRRLRIALLLVLAANSSADDGVYFWRARRGDVGERALVKLAGDVGVDAPRPLFLVAEISRENGAPVTRRTDIAGSPALRAMHRPVTLVLRVNPYGGDFAADTVWREAVIAGLLRGRRTLGSAGAVVDEAQLDFDCPQARLADYAGLVSEIKTRLPGVRITVTGMPCWLDRPELAALLAVADGWTLQLHLTALPVSAESLPPLCDVGLARSRIARAAALNRPFRVALPTYAYLAHFDAAGKFAGIEAETPRALAPGHRLVYWSPDYTGIAALTRELKSAPPANLTGVDWYRLPCDDDRLNLTPTAFAKLRCGEAPASGKIEPRVARSPDGRIADITLVNTGELDAETPGVIRIATGARPRLYDLPGSRRIRESDTELVVAPPVVRLRPGESRALGWLRLPSGDTLLSLDTVSP